MTTPPFRLPDSTILDADGKIILFGEDRFLADICEGNCCFICGRPPDATTFNDEHVVPDWLLRRFALHKRNMTLPNGTHIQYDRYKIPCCKDCNELLGRVYETPIAEASISAESLTQFFRSHGPWPFFLWIALIFLKMHLKDAGLRASRDRRQPEGYIGDRYSWDEFFEIHAMVRAPYVGSTLDGSALGSVFVLSALEGDGLNFDYGDLYLAQCAFVRIGDIAIVAVLTDGCAALNCLRGLVSKITGPLSPLQLREFMVRAGAVNLELKVRPRFVSKFDGDSHTLLAEIPEKIEVERLPKEFFGKMMDVACGQLVDDVMNGPEAEELRAKMRTGNWTFLFNDRGEFIRDDGGA